MTKLITVMLTLVLWTTSVEACGWVLWREKHATGGYHSAWVHEAYETKKSCDEAVAAAVADHGPRSSV